MWSSIMMEIGFIAPSESLHNQFSKNCIYIQPQGAHTLQFSFDRLQASGVTYFNVGNPAVEYKIIVKQGADFFNVNFQKKVP